MQPTDVELLERFTANAAGGAIVNAVGPIRQMVQGDADAPRRLAFIAPLQGQSVGAAVQIKLESP